MSPTRFEEEPEWRLLRAACIQHGTDEAEPIGSILQLPIRWKPVSELAEAHGLQPLLHRALVPFQKCIPPQEFDLLTSRQRANLHKAMMLSRELIQILDLLDTERIEVLPYKGLVLAEALYGDMALRQSGDMDLLIRSEDLSRARDALRGLSYSRHLRFTQRQEQAYLRVGYEHTFDSPMGKNLLELQWRIQPRFYAVDWEVEDLFQRAVTASVAGRAVKTASNEDLFLILSLHAAKHLWGKLIWICDIARLMTDKDIDWSQIAMCARDLRIRRLLTCNVLLANQLLDAAIPREAEQCLLNDKPTIDLTQQVARLLYCGQVPEVESFAYFRTTVQLRENLIDRVRLLTRLAFTPGPGEWAAVRLPEPLFPLYHLVRLSRLAARLGRT